MPNRAIVRGNINVLVDKELWVANSAPDEAQIMGAPYSLARQGREGELFPPQSHDVTLRCVAVIYSRSVCEGLIRRWPKLQVRSL